ncbi:MAG: endolytic transglycosylase MltG, partial [Clostridia bacterium]|nr:endolytic transglycosylase MltG [Clostridia bacterium]
RKPVLTYADVRIESPYNTYLHEGLPIGPIASPGLASIKAALYPETTDYYFFVVSATGEHVFSKTLEEHNAAVRQANSSRGTGAVAG